jgi:hypothetical protein
LLLSMARPPSSEIVRFGLALLLAPGLKTSMARTPLGKNAETKSWPLLSNATAFVPESFGNPSIPRQEIAGQRERFDPVLAARGDAAICDADAFL